MSKYPRAEELKNVSESGPLLYIHKSIWALAPFGILFILFLIGIWELTRFMMTTRLFGEGVIASYLSPRMLGILPAIVLVEAIRRHFNDLYEIDREKIVHYSGRISFKYAVPVIRYSDIRGINVAQGLLARIFNYGNVEIGTAASEGDEMVLKAVDAPEELAALIDDLRSAEEASHNNQNYDEHHSGD